MSDPEKANTWETLLLRASVFRDPTRATSSPQEWWKDLAGAEPAMHISMAADGATRDEGPYEPGQLLLTVRPERIDWNWGTRTSTENRLETLGRFEDVAPSFRDIISRWLQTTQPSAVNRLALGATLAQRSESEQDGLVLLQDYLPELGIDPVGSSDFLYRINRPREIQGIRLNRLSQWQVSRFFAIIVVHAPPRPATMSAHLIPQMCAQLELDISTPAVVERDIEPDRMADLFLNFVELAAEVAREGDIP